MSILLISRRTTLLGALISIGVLANVVLLRGFHWISEYPFNR